MSRRRAFETLYSKVGRPWVPPETLLRALLLLAVQSIRPERQGIDQLDCALVFRWSGGLAMDAPVWDVSVFTRNRGRLLAGEVAAPFRGGVVAVARTPASAGDRPLHGGPHAPQPVRASFAPSRSRRTP